MDTEFEKNFEFENDTQKNEFFEYCALYSSFGRVCKDSSARRYKQIFYFMFLLALPLRIPYTALIFVAAAVCSVFEKRETYNKLPQAASLITRVFTEEEPMNLALLLMLMFSTPFVRAILYLCMVLWAFLMWSEWGQEMLD